MEVALEVPSSFDVTLTSSSGIAELNLNGNEVSGTFVFSALEQAGRIKCPIAFDNRETLMYEGQTYLRGTFSRGSALPRYTVATASGTAILKR